VGEVVAFEEIVRMRRQRVARALHDRCCALIADAIALARAELRGARLDERAVRVARLRKLEELHAYAAASG
jgi:hypothetical protein